MGSRKQPFLGMERSVIHYNHGSLFERWQKLVAKPEFKKFAIHRPVILKRRKNLIRHFSGNNTTYSWQRKVYQAVTTESKVCFTEISARPAGRGTAASIESGELRIEIHAGAEAETIRAIIQALKEC